MAIFQLQSTHPKLSYIIGKNSESGMQIKSIRKGKAFGWYSNESCFNVYFKDAENEISYPKDKVETFEYLNVSRYNTPLFPLNVVADYFSTASKKLQSDDVDDYEHHIMVNLVYVELEKYLDFFKNHFKDFHLEWEELAHKNYRINIKTNKTLHSLFNYSNTLFLILSLINRSYFDMTDDTIEKYIRSLSTIDSPFFIRYLFARNVLYKKDQFYRYKSMLEDTPLYKIDFAYGNTATQRKEWITKHLNFEHTIIDIGCGEGFYSIPFSKKIDPLFVHAIDIDEVAREKVKQKVQHHEIENLILYESFDHFLENDHEEKADVLLTEVIEHMEMNSAEDLILKILENINLHKFFITTPNRDFNRFYNIQQRHDDHKWEMNQEEFTSWIQKIIPNSWNISYQGIGDQVNGIHTTQGIIITRKEEMN
jgi:small RNA 2'-O-methyltransferase